MGLSCSDSFEQESIPVGCIPAGLGSLSHPTLTPTDMEPEIRANYS